MQRQVRSGAHGLRRSAGLLALLLLVMAGLAGPVAGDGPGDPTGYEVALMAPTIPQGGVNVIAITGQSVTDARVRFLNTLIDCYTVEPAMAAGALSPDTPAADWSCLLAVSMDTDPGPLPVEVLLWFEDDSRESWTGAVEVADAGYLRQDVTIGSDLGYLLDAEVDRTEIARLQAYFAEVTPVHYWDGAFSPPTPGDFTSPFGWWRLYNETYWGRHTGVDMRGAAGTPMQAAAAGRIVLAELLDVRGNYVLIDHGWGVYSGYAHLSEIHVARGQVVRAGQVLGVSGNTGRSSGPHIHWEMAVNGEWVDPVQFLDVSPP